MAAIHLSRPAARLLVAVLAVVVIVLAVVMWPQPKAREQAVAASPSADITPVPALPPGAMACQVVYPDVVRPFNKGARGTPMTTCSFVEQVRKAFATSAAAPTGITQFAVVSPSTRKWYKVACFPSGDYTTCTGGQGAVIYLYSR